MSSNAVFSTPQSSLLDSIRKTLEQRNLFTARSRNDFVQALHRASKDATPSRSGYIREKIVTEIITSEETYIDGLNQLLEFKECGLTSSILNNLETLVQINSTLLQDIQKDRDSVGKAFVNYAPYLKHYATYAGGFTNANQELQNLPMEVSTLVREKEAEIGKKVQSLLITPIQRIPRYKLLIEQLIGASGGRNSRDLIEALKSLNTVANYMNEFVRQHENSEKLIALQQMLGHQLELVQPGRKLLMSGDATKAGTHKAVHLILTSDNFVVTKTRGEFGKAGSLELNLILPLKTMSVAMTDNGVELQCPPGETFKFESNDNLEWYENIQEAIWELKSKRATLKKPFSSVAEPVKPRKRFGQKPLKQAKSAWDKCSIM